MNLYFTTKKDSTTGLKIKDFLNRLESACDIAEKLADKYGFDEYRPLSLSIITGISSVIFKKEPDMKIWKKIRDNEYMPRLSHKDGKAIKAEFDAVPRIHRRAINECIDWDGGIIYFIGLNFSSKDYFGIITEETWKISMPADCIQINQEQYDLMFRISSKI